MKKLSLFRLLVLSTFFILMALSCSSAPKSSTLLVTVANEATALLELGHRHLRLRELAVAESYYREAYRLYTIIDHFQGRLRAIEGLTLLDVRLAEDEGNVALALRIARDFAELFSPTELASPAKRTGSGGLAGGLADADELMALAEIVALQAQLMDPDSADATYRERSARAVGALKRFPRDQARVYRIESALAARQGDLEGALALAEKASALFKKPLNLLEYANTRYLMGSILSRMGRYDQAIAALLDSFEYDQRAENSRGLAQTCWALSLVYAKKGDAGRAALWERRSRDIYRALSLVAPLVDPAGAGESGDVVDPAAVPAVRE